MVIVAMVIAVVLVAIPMTTADHRQWPMADEQRNGGGGGGGGGGGDGGGNDGNDNDNDDELSS